MSGIVNVRGARSGMVGTTEGTTASVDQGMTLVYTSSGTSPDHQNCFSSTYSTYTMIIGKMISDTDNDALYFRWLSTGTNTITTAAYKGFWIGGEALGEASANTDEQRVGWNQDAFYFYAPGGNATHNSGYGGISGNFTIHNPYPSNMGMFVNGTGGHMRYQGTKTHCGSFYGNFGSTASATGFRMWFGSGSIAQQKVWVYGHKD